MNSIVEEISLHSSDRIEEYGHPYIVSTRSRLKLLSTRKALMQNDRYCERKTEFALVQEPANMINLWI